MRRSALDPKHRSISRPLEKRLPQPYHPYKRGRHRTFGAEIQKEFVLRAFRKPKPEKLQAQDLGGSREARFKVITPDPNQLKSATAQQRSMTKCSVTGKGFACKNPPSQLLGLSIALGQMDSRAALP